MLGLSATLTEAVFVYLCISVFVFVYLHVRHLGTLFLRSLYHYLSENIWCTSYGLKCYLGDLHHIVMYRKSTKQNLGRITK